MIDELIPIERKGIITLYGRVIGTNGKLGQYVIAGLGQRFGPYATYAEAEKVYKKLIAPKTAHTEKE